MRRTILGLAALTASLAPALAARAGLYNSVDQYSINRAYLAGQGVSELKELLIKLRESRVPELELETGSLKPEYEKEAKRLEKKLRDGSLTTLERAELGAYYIRLGQAAKARDLLEAGDKTHFLILLHLAEAYHETGVLSRAVVYQEQALGLWPTVWAQWTGWEWGFYRRAEQLYLKLLRLRFAAGRAGREPRGGPSFDPLFPEVRFVGPSGEYEAGNIKQEEIDKLPDTAFLLTFQLALWRPHDDRLVWLLAELIHIGGRIDVAWDLMEYIQDSSKLSSWRLLHRHRQILFDKAKAMRKLQAEEQELLYELVGWTNVRTPAQGSVGGAVGSELCRWTPKVYPELERKRRAGLFWGLGGAPTPDPKGDSTSGRKAPFDWWALAVGFGSGVAVALLMGLQWQEWRCRLAARRAEAEAEA